MPKPRKKNKEKQKELRELWRKGTVRFEISSARFHPDLSKQVIRNIEEPKVPLRMKRSEWYLVGTVRCYSYMGSPRDTVSFLDIRLFGSSYRMFEFLVVPPWRLEVFLPFSATPCPESLRLSTNEVDDFKFAS